MPGRAAPSWAALLVLGKGRRVADRVAGYFPSRVVQYDRPRRRRYLTVPENGDRASPASVSPADHPARGSPHRTPFGRLPPVPQALCTFTGPPRRVLTGASGVFRRGVEQSGSSLGSFPRDRGFESRPRYPRRRADAHGDGNRDPVPSRASADGLLASTAGADPLGLPAILDSAPGGHGPHIRPPRSGRITRRRLCGLV